MRTLFALLMLVAFAAPATAQSAQDLNALVAPVGEMSSVPTPIVLRTNTASENRGSNGIIPASWRPRSTTLNWIDYSVLAVTGVAAVVAIHYKFEADERYAEYQQTGDPALRSDIKALDRRSGIALIGMQAGVATFAVRLLLR